MPAELSKTVVLLLVIGLAVYLLTSVGRMYWLAKTSGKLIKASKPYSQSPPNPKERILILGDSTAVGVGASEPKYTLTGLIGAAHPEAKITNLAVSGMRTPQLAESLLKSGRFDLIVVHIGANDVIRQENLEETKQNLVKIIGWASQHSKEVGWFTSGKIGEAPFFAWYLKPLLNNRALKLRGIAIELASKYQNVHYVDLVKGGKDIFADDPARYYAPDGLHLSDSGNERWYQELLSALAK